MSRYAAVIELSSEEKQALKSWVRAGTTPQRLVDRARIILRAAEGCGSVEIAEEFGTRPARVSKWRTRFARQRLAALQDAPRSGKPRRYDHHSERRILELLDQPPPAGFARWNGHLLSEHLKDVSDDQVWRVLRRHRISVARRRSGCIRTDPQFAAKAADIVGLYLNPPENAVVLCVDEKPSIQALERAQGRLRLPDGRALSGFSHDYVRHGTTTLFAALEVASGLVKTGHYSRRRRREFLDFMNDVLADHPQGEVHVILDNLNTHKPKHDRWRARHPRVHFHLTPTHASWLNQVECGFSILTRSALSGASFTSPEQLRNAIDRFVTAYNPRATPFEWTPRAVGPKTLKRKYADLCN